MVRPILLASLIAVGACTAPEQPFETHENELVLGTLDAAQQFAPFVRDDDGRYLVEVVLGPQGADMAVIVAELPAAHIGTRVDFSCWIETASWSSHDNPPALHDLLVPANQLLYAPFLVLDEWSGQATDAVLSCEVSGPHRADITTLEARLVSPS
jgi:hypothetical protein